MCAQCCLFYWQALSPFLKQRSFCGWNCIFGEWTDFLGKGQDDKLWFRLAKLSRKGVGAAF